MDKLINEANEFLDMVKVYYQQFKTENSNIVLCFEAIYTSDYNKEVFDSFIEILYNEATVRVHEIPGFDKVFSLG